jgi:hypothetical protein
MSEDMKFASVGEAIQHLSDFTGQKVVIAKAKIGLSELKKGDLAAILHPQDNKYYVFEMSEDTLRPGSYFNESDLKNTSPYSGSREVVDYAIDKAYGLHSRIKEIEDGNFNIETAPLIVFSDPRGSENELKSGEFEFETDRKYEEVTPINKKLIRINKNRSRAKKHVKKEIKNVDVNQVLKNVQNTKVGPEMFASTDEAIQYLADFTGKKIVISSDDASPAEISSFINSYITTLLWSSNDNSNESGGDPLDDNYDESDIAPEYMKEIKSDCEDFIKANYKFIEKDMSQAGHDFWLTRNGHGAGFWDGDWELEIDGKNSGKHLTEMSKPYGGEDPYVGDDGKIYA